MNVTNRAKRFMRGASAVLEIWPNNRHHYRRAYPHSSEAEALRGDWEKVGRDIEGAIQKTPAHR